jgi:predicted nucleotidyltransferase
MVGFRLVFSMTGFSDRPALRSPDGYGIPVGSDVRVPEYTYIEVGGRLIFSALGTTSFDGFLEAFPIYRHEETTDGGHRRTGYEKFPKENLVSGMNGVTDTSPLELYGVAIDSANVERIWLPVQTLETMVGRDETIRSHFEIISYIRDIIATEALIVGSRSLGLGNLKSDIDVLFRGLDSYRRFEENIDKILQLTELLPRDRSAIEILARRYSKFYQIPLIVAKKIWEYRATKLRTSVVNMSFHFSHEYDSAIDFIGKKNEYDEVDIEATITDDTLCSFMPRTYFIVRKGIHSAVCTKLFLYSGVAGIGDRVRVRGAQVDQNTIWICDPGHFIVRCYD